MKKFVGTILLSAWFPFVLALSFPESADGWYTLTGIIWLVFGTWAGILLVNKK